jgi:hypothetical protein
MQAAWLPLWEASAAPWHENTLPPAARGALFVKTAPLDPLQKLLINFIHLDQFVG